MAQNQRDEKREKLLQRIKDFRLFDDNFMTKCFENNIDCVELLLHIIMDKPDLKVKKVSTQCVIKNLQGRSATLDIDAIDSENKKYDIEVQRAGSGAKPKRARYHSSLIDANSLLPGNDTEDLPETYVIFITEHDVIGKNKPLYHIKRYIEETGDVFDDASHILFVNGEYRDDTPLGLLMKDFSYTNPSDMHYKILADRTRYFKENAKGVGEMCQIMEELLADEKKEIASRMLRNGKLSTEEIAECSGLSLDVVNALEEEQNTMTQYRKHDINCPLPHNMK